MKWSDSSIIAQRSKIKDQSTSFRVSSQLQPCAGRVHAALRAAGWSAFAIGFLLFLIDQNMFHYRLKTQMIFTFVVIIMGSSKKISNETKLGRVSRTGIAPIREQFNKPLLNYPINNPVRRFTAWSTTRLPSDVYYL